MALPAFADLDDLSTRVPGGISDDDVLRAQAALDDASSAIRTCAGVAWVAEGALDFGDLSEWRQGEIRRICVAAASRAFTNPDRASAMGLGDASLTLADASPDVYLNAAEKATIRSMVLTAGGVPGLASIRVVAPAAASGSRSYCDFDQILESDTGS